MNGGRFDFDDGGTYCGGWEEAKAHGHGICTGPEGKGEYAGAWHYGFEVSGVYTWPTGTTYEGQWQNGKRHGLGIESRGRWVYQGEWAQGLKGRYGLRQSRHSKANYLGTWFGGLHDGYGTETYADGGTYKGQWLRGMRHGYGIRTSAPYAVAAKYRARSHTNASFTSLRSDIGPEETSDKKKKEKSGSGLDNEDEFRGGFVLRLRSDAPTKRRRSLSERSLAVKRTILSNLRIKKQHSTGDIHQRVTSMTGSLKSSGSTMSCTSDEDGEKHLNDYYLAPEERVADDVVESYRGEWKNDKRSGFGICDRTDGVRFAGEWASNRKHGYGITFFKDGTKEEGRYKNNILVCSTRRKGLLFVRSSKLRERIEASIEAAKRAADMAAQRVDIAMSRTATAQERSEAAIDSAARARDDANTARIHAAQFDPNFRQPGIEHIRQARHRLGDSVYQNHVSFESTGSGHPVSFEQPHHSQNYLQPDSQLLPHSSFNNPQFYPQQDSYNHQATTSNSQPQQLLHPSMPTYENQASQRDQHGYEEASTPQNHQALQNQYQTPQIQLQNQQQTQPFLQQQYQPQGLQANDRSQVPNNVNIGNTHVPDVETLGNHINYNPQTSQQPDEAHIFAEPVTRFRKDDHYDQYAMNRSNSAGGPHLRRNRPSLTRQSEVLADGVHLNRRSTLASARDRAIPSKPANSFYKNEPASDVDERGSLPNLDELAQQGVCLRREDAARLASQRRQEAQRLQEEEELLRANPLRYLYHPALRNWIYNNKGLILLVAFNVCLIYVLFYLLTYDRNPND
ncbi:unnamed protein product [Bursaphelenchus xylophilus]|uniref:(pine wood nematode) hypothetical protein n=1 Tax=Bursaphelenchus xylophilus TaxID=6326 RepID=A0A7I8XIQ8_BURXY|nr:unnamed protein product [Bursaphelenchus xylophilus]CAG9085035.1 unnamed protein product [Bursaphelenchus xylophilus]